MSPDIPPTYTLATLCDPELAIARARASQDDNAHRPLFVRPIPILVLAKASLIIEQYDWLDFGTPNWL